MAETKNPSIGTNRNKYTFFQKKTKAMASPTASTVETRNCCSIDLSYSPEAIPEN